MSFISQFTCAVCQGCADSREAAAEHCVLGCGHAYHRLCLERWLERSSSCPSCRTKVTRKSVRPLVGVDSVAEADAVAAAAAGGGDEALQQRLADKQRQVEALQQQLVDRADQAAALEHAVAELAQREGRLEAKLAEAKQRSAQLAAAHLEDLRRISSLSADKQQLLERYKTDTQRLQLQLRDEAAKQRQAVADLRRLQLVNPQLQLAAIQELVGGEDDGQSCGALAAALAARNRDLQAASDLVQQLQQQLRQQEAEAARALERAQEDHEAALGALEKSRQCHMRDALQLEYDNSKLRSENGALAKKLEELRGVLVALEGGAAAPARGPAGAHCALPAAGWSTRLQQQGPPAGGSRGADQQPCGGSPAALAAAAVAADAARAPTCTPEAAEEVRRNVSAAVKMLHPAADRVKGVPSFTAAQRGAGGLLLAGSINGTLIRQGPDGRGGTATHLGGAKRAGLVAAAGKRVAKRRPGEGGGRAAQQAGIAAYFGR